MKPKLPSRKRSGKCHRHVSLVAVVVTFISSLAIIVLLLPENDPNEDMPSTILSLRALEKSSIILHHENDEDKEKEEKNENDNLWNNNNNNKDKSDPTMMTKDHPTRIDPPSSSSSSSLTKHNLRSSKEGIHVFIGIKTRLDGRYQERLPQIQKTWLKGALHMGIDVIFFPEESPRKSKPELRNERENLLSSNNNDSNNNNTLYQQQQDPSQGGVDIKDMMVPLKCKALVCKTGAMFKHYMDHYARKHETSFFCNFDDDNYVLPANLIRVLTSYHETLGTDIYVGKQGTKDGLWYNVIPGDRESRVNVKFLTGGAGYCLSKDLVERGQQHLSSLPNGMPDDLAVGYVVQEKLGVKLIEDDLFHSHLEGGVKVGIWFRLPQDQISKQVSFGYNNKHQREWARYAMPNVPVVFSQEEDPLLFRSLHSFLMNENTTSS